MLTKLPDNSVIATSLTEAKTASYIESQFNHQNYFIGTNRTQDQLIDHIYRGKLAEFIVQLKLQKLGYQILHGVRILQQKPDNGTDLIVKTDTGRIIQIQVKLFNGIFYNIYKNKKLEDLINYKGYILICCNETQQIYLMTKKNLLAFKEQLLQKALEKNIDISQLPSSSFHMPIDMLKESKKLNAFIVQ